MKKLLISILLITHVYFAKSADLIVEEFSVPPIAYPSITAAINAASDGDRIIIKNRFGNIPWSENLTLNKSLTLISNQNDATFLLDGNITIVPTANKEVTIIGAEIYNNKDILVGSGTIAQRSMKVNVFACKVNLLTLANQGILAQIAGNDADEIYLQFGDVIGNITNKITLSNSLTSSSTFLNDSCYIMGNDIDHTSYNSASAKALTYSGGGEHVFIKNNDIDYTSNFTSYLGGSATSRFSTGVSINIKEPTKLHEFYNNDVRATASLASSAGSAGHSISCTALGITAVNLNVMNNEILAYAIKIYGGTATARSIQASGSAVDGYFNKLTGLAIGLRNNLQNSSSKINKGNPAPLFTDIDLTRNDIGKEGGPIPYSNFQPALSGSARIYLVSHPFYIRQGNTLKVKAIGYDR